MNIGDEAVEAAAVAVRAAAWGHISPEEAAREILEAAAPDLMAAAWDEGFLAADITATGYPDNPYRSAGAGE